MSTAPTPAHPGRAPGRLKLTLAALAVVLLAAIFGMLVVDRIFFHSSSNPAGTGSGVAATQTRALPPFTAVDLAGANNVIVQVGARQSVVVHADSNLLRRVTTRVRSGKLVIATTPGSFAAKTPMFVQVRLPSLDRLRLQGAGNITVTGIKSRNLTVALPGSGNIDATGTATRLKVTLSGEGNALLRQLIARDAHAALTGEGSIMLTATHSLTARISGDGTVLYSGNPPHVTQEVTGSGTISPQ
jgi:Putative auto-transporter adhesin, head GIN domain